MTYYPVTGKSKLVVHAYQGDAARSMTTVCGRKLADNHCVVSPLANMPTYCEGCF